MKKVVPNTIALRQKRWGATTGDQTPRDHTRRIKQCRDLVPLGNRDRRYQEKNLKVNRINTI